jgi:hypothetical protein
MAMPETDLAHTLQNYLHTLIHGRNKEASMHALLLPQFFDPPLPAAEKRPVSRRFFRAPTPSAAVDAPAGEGLLSLSTLHDRLALLAKLELPCTILAADPAVYLRSAVIGAVGLAGDTLDVVGQGFSLRLRGPDIRAIRLVGQREAVDGVPRLDIHHSHGMLYASIRPAPDGLGGAVWQDVMDNPSLPLG